LAGDLVDELIVSVRAKRSHEQMGQWWQMESSILGMTILQSPAMKAQTLQGLESLGV
jgi:hypothetical protein